MARTIPLALTALGAVGILVGGAAIATADDRGAARPKEKPAVVVPGNQAAADASLLAAHTQVTGDSVVVHPGQNLSAAVLCPSGQVPTGGGGTTSAFRIFLTDSYPSGSAWIVRGTNTNNVDESIRAYAVCTTP
ncbi:hypothetical protein PUR61_35700 [Streptomyces sp. BE20]|uniref:hypothetical protein n=1 Tax=Streptomyces sp. BE20 TaxID=3002525 RepID=UPI002E760FD2|nr:hypothetical protein [Streptomyces sp. BE20]MEE1827493.1 hypothetical protein [Streptomyces sp. BE20]